MDRQAARLKSEVEALERLQKRVTRLRKDQPAKQYEWLQIGMAEDCLALAFTHLCLAWAEVQAQIGPEADGQ